MDKQSAVDCSNCGRSQGRAAYTVRRSATPATLCFRCVVRYRPMLRRSVIIGIVVGTILTFVNHGPELLATQFEPQLGWQIPMNYAIPFLVATVSAIVNARTKIDAN